MSTITLESVEQSFQDWRLQRVNRTERIPKNLWVMAMGLYPQYKRAIICRRLKLSGGQFKQHLESDMNTPLDTGFVLASKDWVELNSAPNLDIQLTIQGKERVLKLCVGIDILGQVLPHFEALL